MLTVYVMHKADVDSKKIIMGSSIEGTLLSPVLEGGPERVCLQGGSKLWHTSYLNFI